jgi:hypothetical protein
MAFGEKQQTTRLKKIIAFSNAIPYEKRPEEKFLKHPLINTGKTICILQLLKTMMF